MVPRFHVYYRLLAPIPKHLICSPNPQAPLYTLYGKSFITQTFGLQATEKAVHGLPPETSRTVRQHSKKFQEQSTQDDAPGVGAAKSGTKSAPSFKASVEVNAPLPKLIIKFKIPRNTKA